MSDFRLAVWAVGMVIGVFLLFSIALSIVGSLLGTNPGAPNAAGVVLGLLAFASAIASIYAITRIRNRYQREVS